MAAKVEEIVIQLVPQRHASSELAIEDYPVVRAGDEARARRLILFHYESADPIGKAFEASQLVYAADPSAILVLLTPLVERI